MMIRVTSLVLALFAGSASAGELMDCFNDETDTDVRYTRAEPDVLRVSDAEVEEMLRRIRASERRTVAGREHDSTLWVSLADDAPAAD